MLYKNHYEALESNIEERRELNQYYANSLNTSGTSIEIALVHEFPNDVNLYRVARGYIKNDDPTVAVQVEFKFTTNEDAEGYSQPIIVDGGDTLDLYELPLISVIKISNIGADIAPHPIRIFAT
tara:strand:- start:17187 stop:17558 length:372 start_codon:yes stop_codon:yes gene_type:complete